MDDSNSLVIVAIPEVDSPVWKVSSEKVPHMTLLFLGDKASNDDIINIAQFLQHCVDVGSVTRFGANVDRRGPLGPDDADVLFFDKKYRVKDMSVFREMLLQNEAISKLYNSVDQFPEWTPHLTLGYPVAPAHADTREYPGIHYVDFDKIALWTGDSTGPEFSLKSRDDFPEVSMSTGLVENVLAHHGVKGMKWGVRRSRVELGRSKGKGPAHVSDDAMQVKVAKAKVGRRGNTDALTTKELQAMVTRMNLEKQYASLRPTPKGKALAKAGSKFATDILVNAGKQTATSLVKSQLDKQVQELLNKKK